MVRFAGDGEGVGQLTWAQRNIWRMMDMLGTPEMVGGAMPLQAGTTVQQIVNLLSFIMSRHQSLRTRIRVEPDGDPVQVLYGSGETALEIHDIDDDDDPARVGEEIRERFETSPFDIEHEWPVRMAVIRQNEKPVWFVAMYPHMVIDGYGFEALTSDLANLNLDTGEHLAPRQGIQPMELATAQQTPAARRTSDHAMRYWGQLLRGIPARRFNEAADRREPRWWDGIYDSPAGFKALRVLADRTRLHSGPILMAAYAVAIAKVTRITPSVIRTLVSNRFRPGFNESVSVLVQPGICAVDVDGQTFDQVAQRAFRSQLAAGKHGYYDPRDLWALIERVNHERGVELDLMCYFNDRRLTFAQMPDSPLPTIAEITEALPRSTWKWGVRTDNPDAKAYLNVNSLAETLNYDLRVDTHALSPLELVEVLRLLENTLVAAVVDPDAVITVSR